MERVTVSTDDRTRQRVQLDFCQDAFDRLEQIKRLADAKTNAEVVRNALRVYEWFLQQKREGFKLRSVKGDTVREVAEEAWRKLES